jgi:hypothetical protein
MSYVKRRQSQSSLPRHSSGREEELAGDHAGRKVKAKLASYSRGIVEGSAEWDVLYRKTFEEEARKHAKA